MGRVRRPNRGLRAASTTALVVGLACTPKGQSNPPQTEPGRATPAESSIPAEPAPFEAFVVGRAEAPTEDEAREAALAQLESTFLGSGGWSKARGVTLHDPQRDPMRVTELDGAVRVELGLTESHAAAKLSELELATLVLQGPVDWQDTIRAAILAQTAATVCQRRAELFNLPCDPPDTEEAATQLASLAAGIAVTPIYPDGLPLDPRGTPLRRDAVFVFWHGNPVADVPLRGTTADGREIEPLSTDRQGRAILPLSVVVEPNASVHLEIDAESLLGPVNADWPKHEAKVGARPLDIRRFAVISAKEDAARDFVTSVRSALAPGLGGAGLTLASKTVAEIQRANDTERATRLARAAEAARGALDFVLLTTSSERFANRAGGGRVWFEATGSIDIRNAWTGQTFAAVEASVTANGVGHDRARAAARRKLAGELAKAAAKKLGGTTDAKPATAMLGAPN